MKFIVRANCMYESGSYGFCSPNITICPSLRGCYSMSA